MWIVCLNFILTFIAFIYAFRWLDSSTPDIVWLKYSSAHLDTRLYRTCSKTSQFRMIQPKFIEAPDGVHVLLYPKILGHSSQFSYTFKVMSHTSLFLIFVLFILFSFIFYFVFIYLFIYSFICKCFLVPKNKSLPPFLDLSWISVEQLP